MEVIYLPKITKETIAEELNKKSYKLIGDYIDFKTKITIECPRGHKDEIYHYRFKNKGECAECKVERISREIRSEIESQGYLLHNEYERVQTNLIMTCPNGHDRNCKIFSFRKYRCGVCIDEAKRESAYLDIINMGFKILEKTTYAKDTLKVECPNGHIWNVNIYNIKTTECSDCNDKRIRPYTIEEVRSVFEQRGFTLLSDKYVNCKDELSYLCSCGRLKKTNFDIINHSEIDSCTDCKGEKVSIRMRGENHPNWQGGFTNIKAYLRNNIVNWKKESMYACNYKCVITGDDFDDIHHLHSFNLIFKELINETMFELKDNFIEHNKDEIEYLENKIVELHNKYGLGVCLRKDIHSLFHVLYGRGDNTPEQFDEFKTRCSFGEFSLVV